MEAKQPSSDQYSLDFTSRRNELLALVSSLSRLQLCDGQGVPLSRGRIQGVVDLLKRLILLAREIPWLKESIDPLNPAVVYAEAQVIYLAASMEGFRVVSERTLRNWRQDAEAIGVLTVEFRSHEFGRREWNAWSVLIDRLRVLGGSGRQWAATISAPGAATISAPGAATISAPHIPGVFGKSISPGTGPARPAIDSLPEWPELRPFCETRIEPLSDEETAWLSTEVSDSLIGQRAFEPLTERWLSVDRAMRLWHAWQLRMADPAVGPTRAHQLLVVSAARHATSIPQSRIHRSRVGLFVGIVSKRTWEPVRCRLEGILHEMLVPT